MLLRCIDTETTGLEPTDDVVEVGCYDLQPDLSGVNADSGFQFLVRPAKPIPPEASAIHHLTNDDVTDAAPWADCWPLVLEAAAVTDDVFGDATFAGENDSHRLMLSRQLYESEVIEPYVLFIGLNPSTASEKVDDPTIRREWLFARRWGFKRMVKVNVMSYRATFPKDLLLPGVIPNIPENLAMIRSLAARSAKIVCCWGAVHYKLRRYSDAVERMLRDDGHHLWCFGLTKAGLPRHPLYLPNNTELIPLIERTK